MKSLRRLLIAPAFLVLACQDDPQESSPPGGSTPPLADGGQTDLRPRLLLRLLSRGASAQGTTPGFQLDMMCTALCQDPTALAALVTSHVSVQTLTQGTVATAVSVIQPSLTAVAVTIHLAPVSPLAPDSWASLQLVSDGSLVFGSEDDSAAEGQLVLDTTGYQDVRTHTASIPFFTGSLPHFARVHVTSTPSKPPSLQIHFSEPVVLGQLAASLTAELNGAPLAGCVWAPLEHQCAQTTSTAVVQAVDFLATAAPAEVTRLTLRLGGDVRGVSRTIAEAADFSAQPVESVATWAIEGDEWGSCASSPGGLCARRSSP